MTYYADLSNDLPAPHKSKRAIFYRQGLKVYGLIPYILQRKLKAQFFSGSFTVGGSGFPRMLLSAGSFESNWTAIPYIASPEAVSALLDWLYSDRGFEVALASTGDWDDDIFSSNIFRMPPKTWFPLDSQAREGFLQIAGQSDMSRQNIARLLALSAGNAAIPEPEEEQ